MKCALKTRLRCAALSAAGLWLAGCTSKSGAPGQAPPDFGAFFKATQQRLNTPSAASAPAQTPVAFIDVAAIAARHPAWRLANALEKRSDKTLSFSGLSAPQSPQAVELRSAPLQRAVSAPPQATSETEDGAPIGEVAAYSRPPQRLGAREAVPLEKAAQSRQQAAFTGFLGDIAERQQAAREEEHILWHTELEDEIEAQQRLSLTGLEPILPPLDVQLEMTNLRLKLLSNLNAKLFDNSPLPDAERAAALMRLRYLEAKWRGELRVQENARLEELKKLQFEMPEKMRNEGKTSMAERLQTQSKQDTALRESVAGALRERIAAGFSPAETGAPDGLLFIRLPGAGLAAQGIENSPASQAGALAWVRGNAIAHRIDKEIISTNGSLVSSAGAFSGEKTIAARPIRALQSAPRALNRAQTLRRQAWQEAERWAQAIARRRGWKLQTRHAKGTPDRTGEALRLLNLS